MSYTALVWVSSISTTLMLFAIIAALHYRGAAQRACEYAERRAVDYQDLLRGYVDLVRERRAEQPASVDVGISTPEAVEQSKLNDLDPAGGKGVR